MVVCECCNVYICKTDEVMYLEKHFSKSCGFFDDKREREREKEAQMVGV